MQEEDYDDDNASMHSGEHDFADVMMRGDDDNASLEHDFADASMLSGEHDLMLGDDDNIERISVLEQKVADLEARMADFESTRGGARKTNKRRQNKKSKTKRRKNKKR